MPDPILETLDNGLQFPEAPLGEGAELLKVAIQSIDLAHAGRTDNPHEVTAVQVGAAAHAHGHVIGDVDDLVNELAGKASVAALDALEGVVGGKAAEGHTHTQADVDGLATALASKAAAAHSHTLADVVDAGTAAAASTGDFAPASHTHTMSQVTGLVAELSSKATTAALDLHALDVSNPHEVTAEQVGAYTTAEVDAIISSTSPATHGHVIGDVVDLEDELASKANQSDLATLEGIVDADAAKLLGIEPNATANSTDADLLNRANHTGSQAIATITGLGDELSDTLGAISAHTGNVANPHEVTAEQVGALTPTNVLDALPYDSEATALTLVYRDEYGTTNVNTIYGEMAYFGGFQGNVYHINGGGEIQCSDTGYGLNSDGDAYLASAYVPYVVVETIEMPSAGVIYIGDATLARTGTEYLQANGTLAATTIWGYSGLKVASDLQLVGADADTVLAVTSVSGGVDAPIRASKYVNAPVPLGLTIDSGGAIVITGVKGPTRAKADCVIKTVYIDTDTDTSCSVAVYVNAALISASAPITLTAAKSGTAALTGWTLILSKGDQVTFDVTSNTAAKRITITVLAEAL